MTSPAGSASTHGQPSIGAVASSSTSPVAHPPETLEGWYVLHQLYSCASSATALRVESTQLNADPGRGWSAIVRLIGSRSDYLAMHCRPTLDEIGEAQRQMDALATGASLTLDSTFLSVTEAGLYHITAQLARDAQVRGGKVGDEQYVAELAKRAESERESPHVRRRLYPTLPDGMPYVCFYPMSKRRQVGQNWYTLSLDERSRLMQAHGLTGRRYAGRVVQVITGAIGFENWEWGVTLFARDPLDFKKLVTEMRFDEVSAKYADFGEFYVGRLA